MDKRSHTDFLPRTKHPMFIYQPGQKIPLCQRATIINQRSFGLIRPNFPNENKLFIPNCKILALVIDSYITLKLSFLSQNKLFNPNC